jgi:hypothetical protein
MRDIASLDGAFDRFPWLGKRRAGVLEDLLDGPVDSFAPNMSASMSAVARRDMSIAASITTVARNRGPNAPRSTPAGSSARVCVPHTGHATCSS